MQILPMYEFLLWNNCNNNCKFCWQRKEKQSTHEEQIEAIDLTVDYINKLYNAHVLVIGGEIFAETNPEIKINLHYLFLNIIKKMLKNEIEQCYINTNLLYNLNSLLLPILNLFKEVNLIERIHFTTSADDFGRFNNTNIKSLFYDNLNILRKLYPTMYIICNIILTDSFCDSVLSDKFNLAEYKKLYNVDVNTIPYIKYGIEIAAPTREKAFNTLMHLNEQDPDYLLKYTNNWLLGQNFILHQYQNGKLVNVSSDKSKCGHSENFKKCYIDSDECFVCDCSKLREAVYGIKEN